MKLTFTRSKAIAMLVFMMLLYSFFEPIVAQETSSETWKLTITELEKKFEVTFFYLNEWLPKENAKKLTYNDLESALSQLVEDTDLNFYYYKEDQRVFLIKNSVIYDQFPLEGWMTSLTKKEEAKTVTMVNVAPILLAKNQKKNVGAYPTIMVGKAKSNSNKQEFVITGQAVMETTDKPISDLVINILPENFVVVTDSLGRFKSNLKAGYHQIMTSAMGTTPSKRALIVYNDGEFKLPVRESLELLDEVVVHASARRKVESTNTGSDVINLEENKNVPVVFGERDLLQIAKSLPGISSAGEGASGLNVRGGKTDQNLVLLDGGVIYNPTHFFGIFQALNPFATQGADIYKANLPVEYGGRLSSLLDIKTINGNQNEFHAEGSVGPVTANLALEIPIKKDTSGLVLAGRAAYANWILEALDNPELSNSEASFFDALVKYRHRINEKNLIQTTLYASADDFSITSDSLYKYANKMGSLSWIRQNKEYKTTSTTLYHSSYGFGIDFETNLPNSFNLDYEIQETGLRFKVNLRQGKNTLTYGIDQKYYSVSPGNLNPLGGQSTVETISIPNEQALEGALFMGKQYTLNERLNLDLAARLTYFGNLGSALVQNYEQGQPRNQSTVVDTTQFGSGTLIRAYFGPELRIGGRYLLNQQTSVKASIGNSYQYIHTLSNNTTVSPIDTWKLSDYHIEPQRALQGSVGIFRNIGGDAFEISIEGYYRLMDKVLDFKTGASLFLNENVETEVIQGDGRAYGVEFLVKKNGGKWNGWLAYTLSRSLYRFQGDFPEQRINGGDFFPSNYDRPHDVSLITNFRLTRRFSFSGNFVYQTGRPVTYPIGRFQFNNADFVAFSNRNEYRIPDFYRLDLGINIEGNHKKNKLAHSFITLQVYNVLGRNNPFSQFFVTDNGEIRAFESSIFAVPIPSITYNFKF